MTGGEGGTVDLIVELFEISGVIGGGAVDDILERGRGWGVEKWRSEGRGTQSSSCQRNLCCIQEGLESDETINGSEWSERQRGPKRSDVVFGRVRGIG